MHSHDRTLLGRLGFADPDKREPRHDLACRYLAQPEVARRIAEVFVLPPFSFEDEWSLYFAGPVVGRRKGSTAQTIKGMNAPRFEWPLNKGEGQYKTTIGFIDLVIRADVEEEDVFTEEREPDWQEKRKQGSDEWIVSNKVEVNATTASVYVEVKITQQPIGEIVRQLHLYREYLPSVKFSRRNRNWGIPFVLATAFPLSADALNQLKDDRIKHVFLGEKFNAFCTAQNTPRQGEMFEV